MADEHVLAPARGSHARDRFLPQALMVPAAAWPTCVLRCACGFQMELPECPSPAGADRTNTLRLQPPQQRKPVMNDGNSPRYVNRLSGRA